ncbi:DUF4007 family protein [Brevibacillus borstelensis]|uniref:DUF4007 family protein n=1 Tax=Brevibacillus borstelensis TaxID=45462 RepID=UPI002E20FF26|nr:DUF4007 family protein [Brevibacillus borstelensis]
MAYARHQSFYIRDKWFSKGLRSVSQDRRFFYDDYSFEKIGLGKNMLEALKYWLLAFNVIEEKNDGGNRGHVLTELGKLIYENDKLLQFPDTLSILHYNLICNDNDHSTVFEWFFNKYKETVVTKPDLINSFITWVQINEPKEVSEKSLKRDIDCLVQFYTKKANDLDPEDIIFCPFSKLSLLSIESSGEGYDIIKKNSPDISNIGVNALYYVLLDNCEETDLISVDNIFSKEFLWGKTFNLSRNKIIEALNILTNHEKFPIQYVRTNNLDYVRVPKVSPVQFLKTQFYERMTTKNGF